MRPNRKTLTKAEFEAIYQRHSREVWALAYARWLNAELAQDVMQEAFLRFWKQSRTGEPVDNPGAWLLRVARNLAEDQAKSAFRRNGTQAPEAMNAIPGRPAGPLDRMEREETLAQVRSELEGMALADREILTLRYALDYDASEIATMLAINAAAVHMRLSRARQRLAERLTAKGIRETP